MIHLFVDHLTVIDCSLLDAQRGLLGESWIVDLDLSGTLNAEGMIFDFAQVKKRVKALIDEYVDHRLLVPCRSPCLDSQPRPPALTFNSAIGPISHQGPADAVCRLDSETITTRSVERHLQKLLEAEMPGNVQQFCVSLRREATTAAPCYQYSHGLKLHEGNCQRIAHGHRSRIRVWQQGQECAAAARKLAIALDGRYIGNRADLTGRTQQHGKPCFTFAYQAPSGAFRLTLPEAVCYLIDTDSTVENIAQHLAAKLHAEDPQHQYRVQAYEGVDKGAIGET